MNGPCYQCPERDYPHCYGVCSKYLAFRAELDEQAKQRLARQNDPLAAMENARTARIKSIKKKEKRHEQ